ncbi:restriction endonuclease subunit S [bacterium]|nr:restriction endonuclease subunit S [bacterium]
MIEKVIKENPYLFREMQGEENIVVFFIYDIYSLKKTYPDMAKFSFAQFLTRSSIIANKDQFMKKLTDRIPQSFINNAYENSFNYIFKLDFDDLETLLIELIEDYLSNQKIIDIDVEKLNKYLLKEDLGRVLISSLNIKKFLYDGTTNVSHVTYDFYDENINILAEIIFRIKNIPHEYFNTTTREMPSDVKFDTILYFPPYKFPNIMNEIARREKLSQYGSVSFEYRMIGKHIQHLLPGGDMLVLVSTGILNKTADTYYKRRILQRGMLKLIIELPRLQIIPFPLSMALLKETDEKDVIISDARKFAQNIRRGINFDSEKIIRALSGQIEGAVALMSYEYIENHDYDITPHRFMESIQTNFINPTPLKDVTEAIFRGFQIPSDLLDECLSIEKTRIKLLTLSDIEDGFVIKESLQSLKIVDKRMNHYTLKDGDLVISCKGKAFKTAVINIPYNETYVSTGSLIVIRVNNEVLDPTYLKIFLDSTTGIEALRSIQTGASILSLNPTKLQNLLIPLPTLSRQTTISSSYKFKLQNIQEVKDVEKKMREGFEKKFKENFLSLLV